MSFNTHSDATHMTESVSHIQHVRQTFMLSVGVLSAILPFLAVIAVPSSAGATGEYVNASIADKALAYSGRWGGEACIASRKPGDSGGQCRSFVNCIVYIASGGTQNLGGRDYFQPFLAAGGTRIQSIDHLQKGDIVQEGQGKHTYIIVNRVADSTFTIVDSNRQWNERVATYDRVVTLDSSKRAYRMGLIDQIAPTTADGVGKPILGALESVEEAPNGAMVKGWTIDGDVTRPISAKIYAGSSDINPETGIGVTASIVVKADDSRLDIAAQNSGYGASHGFRGFVALPQGGHTVCLYGVNAPNTPGADTNLGCRVIIVR